MVKARKYVVTKYFDGVPKRDDFKMVEYELPSLKDGDVIIKSDWISVDPNLRSYNSFNKLPYDNFSYQLGVDVESKNPNYLVGTKVVSHKDWCDYCIANPR